MDLREKKRPILIGVASLVVLLIAGSCIRSRARKNALKHGEAKRGPIVEAVYGIGTVTARRSYQLKLGVVSSVRGLYVEEGQAVRAGAPLVSLEGSTTFRAPFSGTITSLPYKLGESVFPQMPVLTLVDLRDRYLTVSLEQHGAIRVARRQPSIASFESMPGRSFEGMVRTIFSNDSQFIVHVDVKKLPDEILPGMTADVAIETARRENALLIPVAGIQNGMVTRTRRGRTRDVAVEMGTVDGMWAEITKGDVEAGDSILLGGH